MSGRTATFIDTYIERDVVLQTETERKELVDQFSHETVYCLRTI